MPRPIVSPVESAGSLPEASRTSHPAFGQITVNRVSGGGEALYGSDFLHHSYVTVSIYPSVLERSLSHDWHFQQGVPLVSVDLTEAQWSTFVSSFGLGAGSPCTIRRREGAMVPGFPLRDESDKFKGEADAVVADVMDALDALDKALDGVTMPAKSRMKIKGAGDAIRRKLSSHLPYIEQSFMRRMEARVEKAKTEIEGWVAGHVQRAGLKALFAKEAPLSLPDHQEENE